MSISRFLILFFLGVLGVADAAYLTYEHYAKIIVPCSTSIFVDCGKVLESSYAEFYGVPVALIGLIHYAVFIILLTLTLITTKKILKYFLLFQTAGAFLVSLYLLYLQIAVIKSICLYCVGSLLISTLLFIFTLNFFKMERIVLTAWKFALIYKYIFKKIFFLFDPEIVHNHITNMGEKLSRIPLFIKIVKWLFGFEDTVLKQKISAIEFENPVGLAAGFDYQAQLMNLLPAFNFGFETIGTFTNRPYEGNSPPRLGRLPRSRSLMVNKGFKNQGARALVKKIKNMNFSIPIGISIGQTNTPAIKTQTEAIADIVEAFKELEKARLKNSYYELNISCPNLLHKISFYAPQNLKELLTAVSKLNLGKPVFIKMPIDKSDKEIMQMLSVISMFRFVDGVILGNLKTNRNDPAFDRDELKKFPVGNFSGKPTEKRSNELIKLAYGKFGKKLVIIGCGGIFSAEDAYQKIKKGASLVQLITGMIYKGPELITQINAGLIDLLEKDGFTHISQAIGVGD